MSITNHSAFLVWNKSTIEILQHSMQNLGGNRFLQSWSICSALTSHSQIITRTHWEFCLQATILPKRGLLNWGAGGGTQPLATRLIHLFFIRNLCFLHAQANAISRFNLKVLSIMQARAQAKVPCNFVIKRLRFLCLWLVDASSLSIDFKKTRSFPSSSGLRTSPSSHGVYGSKVKKRNKHQYMNSCHRISHHWSNTVNGLHRYRVVQR